MEVVAINVKPEKPARGFKKSVCIVRMDRVEAIKTIESLARQMDTGDCNTGRFECIDKNGCDFSIVVQ